MTSPLWWYAGRGFGLALLIAFSATIVLGLAGASRRGGPVTGLVLQSAHRAMALLSTLLLAVHVVAVSVDSYVDIRWWDAFLPFAGAFRPLPLGLGAVALDLLAVIVVTSVARSRIPDKLWRGLHLLSYPAWTISLVHAIVIGTDVRSLWARIIVAGCAGAVAVAATVGFLWRPAAWSEQGPATRTVWS